jgi:hypothetical protein
VVTVPVADIFNKTKDSTALVVEVELGISITYNGQLQAPTDHKMKSLRANIRKRLQLTHRPHHRTAVKLLQKRKILSDRPRNYRWRTRETTESTILLKNHRVMINHLLDRLLLNSASPSSPKLLLRLQLNLLQISQNQKDHSSLRKIDQPYRHQDLKIPTNTSNVETID